MIEAQRLHRWNDKPADDQIETSLSNYIYYQEAVNLLVLTLKRYDQLRQKL